MSEFIKANFWPMMGAIMGLLIAVLIINVGVFKTLVILVFIALGIVAGFYIKKTGIFSDIFK